MCNIAFVNQFSLSTFISMPSAIYYNLYRNPNSIRYRYICQASNWFIVKD